MLGLQAKTWYMLGGCALPLSYLSNPIASLYF